MNALGQFLPVFFGIIVLGFVAFAGSSVFSRDRLTCEGDKVRQRRGPHFNVTAALLAALVLGSWAWLKTCERSLPSHHLTKDRNLKSLWVLYDKGSSGYFLEAAFQMDSAADFLAGYEKLMREGDFYHVGTHPPGLFLLSKGILNLCEKVPSVVSLLGRFHIREDVEEFRRMEHQLVKVGLADVPRPLEKFELTALNLLAELSTFAAALTVVPLYYTMRRGFHALVAWRAATLFATFPCLAIFLPKSDVAFTFTSMTAVAFGVAAFASRSGNRVRVPAAIGAGLTIWVGLMMSLAHLPVLFLLIVLSVIRLIRALALRSSRTLAASVVTTELTVLGTLIATIFLAAVVFSGICECNLFNIWRLNLVNHAAFYQHHTRTMWKWLLVNPLELSMSVGLPVALTMLGGARILWQRLRDAEGRKNGTLSSDLSIAVLLTLGLLWASSRNSGEAARLWCFLTPWLLVLTGQVLRVEIQSKPGKVAGTVWTTLLGAQMLTGIIVCGRVKVFLMDVGASIIPEL